MISATKSWSTELAPGIRVNAVAPGWVDTDMTAEALSGERREEVLASIPLQRIATPEDIAGAVLFLASPWPGTSRARSSTSMAGASSIG